jgi:hypothetical protein
LLLNGKRPENRFMENVAPDIRGVPQPKRCIDFGLCISESAALLA